MIVARSADLARRVSEEVADDAARRMDRLFLHLFAAPPSDNQQAACLQFVAQQAELFRQDPNVDWQAELQKHPAAATDRAWTSLCQALLASNRFLYID